jgi:hypothetical protein
MNYYQGHKFKGWPFVPGSLWDLKRSIGLDVNQCRFIDFQNINVDNKLIPYFLLINIKIKKN